ncbi:hypothetical protein CEXT_249671 [Caerostris extrusa]|uniref:Uncharacterized protein n=1 Tax=Caerostris extrusa TaxID=172846 RepID=A0AAV4QN27_CAEEX|nr:hypothetical protein CEXT_249671 [Caerostris extrusa]
MAAINLDYCKPELNSEDMKPQLQAQFNKEDSPMKYFRLDRLLELKRQQLEGPASCVSSFHQGVQTTIRKRKTFR